MSLFIHFTTSSTLALLPHTNFEICSIKELLYTHQLAPLAGEINCGGLRGAMLEEGTTAFAKIGDTYWSPNLLHKYGQMNYKQSFSSPEQFIKSIDHLCQSYLFEITVAIINSLRDKQMNCFIQLTDEQKQAVHDQLSNTASNVKKKIICNYIAVRYLRAIDANSKEFSDIYNFIKEKINSIPEDFLDFQDDKKWITLTQLLLNPPRKLQIQDMKQPKQPDNKHHAAKHELQLILQDPSRSEFISFWLDNNFNVNPDLEIIEKMMQDGLKELSYKITFFQKLIEDDNFGKKFFMNPLVTKSFSVAFILENDNLLGPVQYEFRACRNLKLGSDVTTIVTDEENIETVKRYLAFHKFDSISIKSFSQVLPRNESQEKLGFSKV